MAVEHHKFSKDFPEFRDTIHELKLNNQKFAALMKEYDETDDEIYRIEEGIETPTDDYTEALKIKRVELKDKLYSMVRSFIDTHK